MSRYDSFTENGRPHPDHGRAFLDGHLQVVAHAHRQVGARAQQAVTQAAQMPELGPDRLGFSLKGGDAHETREPDMAHGRGLPDQRRQFLRLAAAFLILVADVDLDEDLDHSADRAGASVDLLQSLERGHRLDDIDAMDQMTDLVRLKGSDHVPDGIGRTGLHLRHEFLNAVFAEIELTAATYGANLGGRPGFGNSDEADGGWIAAGPERGDVDAAAHLVEPFAEGGHGSGYDGMGICRIFQTYEFFRRSAVRQPPIASHITDFFDTWAPERTQSDYDNSGLLVGSGHEPIRGILTCLDVTREVVDEALERGANLIVAHHPILFHKISRIRPDDQIGNLLYRLIRENLLVYAAHTNLDAALRGVSCLLGQVLGLQQVRVLAPGADGTGFGAVGVLAEPETAEAFLERVTKRLDARGVRHAGGGLIRTVAVCGGSGASLIPDAIRNDADAYVTADLKYHDFFHGSDGFLLVDAGHYETEYPAVDLLRRELASAFPDIDVAATRHVTNPVQYPTSIDSPSPESL